MPPAPSRARKPCIVSHSPTLSNLNHATFDNADRPLPHTDKDGDLDVVHAFDGVVHLTLDQHMDPVIPSKR